MTSFRSSARVSPVTRKLLEDPVQRKVFMKYMLDPSNSNERLALKLTSGEEIPISTNYSPMRARIMKAKKKKAESFNIKSIAVRRGSKRRKAG
ncbi:MAG: hypothetical protein MI924_05525 [Chloroflexales bacterium]|nr:hypothetical protein [Chloroflexales bacterium]